MNQTVNNITSATVLHVRSTSSAKKLVTTMYVNVWAVGTRCHTPYS